MTNTVSIGKLSSWVFAAFLLIAGILNIILIHPVPGVAYLLLACLYLPPVYAYLTENFHFSIPAVVKIGLGIVLVMFTLGVSDLGDMIDKL
ncbi:MAG: hypothetical protein ACO1OQ_06095 [Rufibacter sp.]